jgi:hypothetical protein
MGGDLVGFSLSWIAVPAAARGKLLDVLKLTPTGNFEEVPKAAASGINLPTGWYVVLRNRVEMTAGTSADLARLSRSIGVIACFVEEHVMVSWARGWSAGTLAWSVCHDLQVGLRHLEASGDLPPEYPAVRDRLLGKQDQDPDGGRLRLRRPSRSGRAVDRVSSRLHAAQPRGSSVRGAGFGEGRLAPLVCITSRSGGLDRRTRRPLYHPSLDRDRWLCLVGDANIQNPGKYSYKSSRSGNSREDSENNPEQQERGDSGARPLEDQPTHRSEWNLRVDQMDSLNRSVID